MYINFWYPVAASNAVTNEAPFRTRLLGHDFVAFRHSDGTTHVLADTCIHRGAALGEGKIVDDCVQCPYHGWRYNGAGECVLIPPLPAEKPPSRAKVDSYPTQERYGIVFAFLGDLPKAERPPLFDIEEFSADDWRANELKVFEVDYYYQRSVENGLDPAHNEFVHPKQGAPGMTLDFQKTPLEIDLLGDYGSGFMMPFSLVKAGEAAMNQEMQQREKVVSGGSGHFGPNVLITWLHFSEENKFHQYFFEAPIDENRTRIFFINMRHFMLDPAMDKRIMDVNMEIAQEDIDLLIKLNPVRTPETLTKELLIITDTPVVKYREFLKDWENAGWRINIEQLVKQRGDVASAIPSPARRTSKSWVLDQVPLIT